MASLHEGPDDDDDAPPPQQDTAALLAAAQPVPTSSSSSASSSLSTSPTTHANTTANRVTPLDLPLAALPPPPPPAAHDPPAPGPPRERPAGGTARSGAKTPRKVQWAAEPARHALDEKGLDPTAFRTLTHALERHRSSAVAAPAPSPPCAPPPLPAPAPAPAAPHLPHRPHTPNHFPPSFPSSPGSPGSYDTDTDPLATSTSPTLTTPTPPAALGEAYIDPLERAGLPGAGSAREAARVVRAHTGHWPRVRRRRRGSSTSTAAAPLRRSEERDPDEERGREEKRRRRAGGVLSALGGLFRPSSAPAVPDVPPPEPDVEHTAPATNAAGAPRRGARGGVLSALLALYDSPYGAHSRGSSLSSVSLRSTSGEREPEKASPVPPLPPLPSLPRVIPKPKLPAMKDLPRALHLTPPERSAAGVFAPLIASTGNIVGAAAPAPASVGPSIRRPGYRLSRYSLDSRIPQAQAQDTPLRPREAASLPASEPASPRSPASPRLPSPASAPAAPALPRQNIPSLHGQLPPPAFHPHPPPGPSRTDSYDSHYSGATTPRAKWTEFVRGWSRPGTPTAEAEGMVWDAGAGRERERRREKKRRRRKEEIYITRHVAEIIQRQEFLLKFARAMMMFGGPTHRLPAQVASTARVLELEVACMYLPDMMLISFDDSVTSTSSVKFIRQTSALDLGKLKQGYVLYWKVIHDEISVKDASTSLDGLMRRAPMYNAASLVFFGGMASASICSVSFKGSLLDAMISFPLGALLVGVQLLSVRNELYSNVFEITIATLLSFVSAALAQTHKFCYSAVASSSVVLILPGFIVLCGSLELSSRNIVSGAVRLCYALVYSLFLGFGLAIGAEVYQKVTDRTIVGPEDYNCVQSHSNAPWFQRTPSLFWAFLTVPMYSLFLSLRNQMPWNRKEMVASILISCVGWVTNHFTGTKFPNQNDISAAVGAFAVGIVANIYGRFFRGNAFVVMITGILFQLPSGLGNGGLLTFAQQQTSGAANSYLSGFQTALQLISVSIGLTVGLGVSLVLMHPIQSRKRQAGVFSL